MDIEAYSAFKKERAKDLRSISSKTRGDLTVEDLENEAWIEAQDESAKRGHSIDWRSPKDQDLILAILTVKHVWRKKPERKRKVSADQERTDHDGNTTTLLDLLPAEETADPLLLEHREKEESEKIRREEEDAILESYSQSVAYNIALWHFDNIRYRLAACLAINRGTLRGRISWAAKSLKAQPSLFDRIEKIDEAFIPQSGRQYAIRVEPQRAAGQWCWEF